MILLSTLSGELNLILFVSLGILGIGLLLKKIGQPYILAYILSGIVLGPFGLGVVTEPEFAKQLGEVGLVVLMFFIGMEISLPDFIKEWRVAFFGTGMQVLFSLAMVALIGWYLGWHTNRIVLLGFIISISSSAVVIKLISGLNDRKSSIHQSVISILLTQDILVVPMMIVITLLSGHGLDLQQVGLQVVGGILIIALIIYILRKKKIKIPFHETLEQDNELQIFAAVILCFGMALISSLFELSASLGALVSGILIGASDSHKWLHHSLHSFRVILISFFFVSVGMLIDLHFLQAHALVIGLLVLVVYISNQGINSLALRFLGNDWRSSMQGGAMLSQIGEFSFVLATLGFQEQIINDYSYRITIIVISLTIFISPLWVMIIQRLFPLRPLKN